MLSAVWQAYQRWRDRPRSGEDHAVYSHQELEQREERAFTAGWEAAGAFSPQPVTLLPDVEQALREYLWLSHGHAGPALYGDDGEMQCGMCRRWFDYRRAPLAEIIWQATETRKAAGGPARSVLPRYVSIVPCAHGGVQIEGHTLTEDWEFEIGADANVIEYLHTFVAAPPEGAHPTSECDARARVEEEPSWIKWGGPERAEGAPAPAFLIAQLRDYADSLERMDVHDDMALPMEHAACADLMREAATRLTGGPAPSGYGRLRSAPEIEAMSQAIRDAEAAAEEAGFAEGTYMADVIRALHAKGGGAAPAPSGPAK